MSNEVTEFMDTHDACREGREWAERYATLAEVWDNCQRGDWLIWLLRRADKLPKRLAVEIAVECAAHVLHHYEERHPGRTEPRKAIEAARTCLENDTAENRQKARNAYAAAYAGGGGAYAYAAAYADAAAYAAYAAAYAAYAYAAYAAYADAAAYAAYAAYAAAYADAAAYATAERAWQADTIRWLAVNPWVKKGAGV